MAEETLKVYCKTAAETTGENALSEALQTMSKKAEEVAGQDLGLAQNAATAMKSPTPMGSLAHQMYRTMTNHGYGGKDFSSAFMFLQDQKKK
ncbi:3-hydroxyisobutyrate dehydrogenase, mitochondrial-like [Mercenaria mercenaria]|uniref:3-hydroxyisobutyrate dehydrogenase, mitochondrial-like n=1 Tax=Mercenaria mercenaria TaxID=6596 RepID=UPI00234F6638|nr:3-hydroxyisobutyrate dehydrogenase, mitochondrial-like [Mercenaria mercenaria]